MSKIREKILTMSKLIKTPLRYPGGKSRMAETFVGLMPGFDEYREPFLGGGSVYLTARQLRPGKKYWVNDLYYDLYCFWHEVQRDNPDLVREIRETRDYWTIGDGADLGGKYMYEKLVADIMAYDVNETALLFPEQVFQADIPRSRLTSVLPHLPLTGWRRLDR